MNNLMQSILTVFVSHQHDEAYLRMRSWLQSAPSALATAPGRSRYSKILNHVVRVHIGKTSIKWLTELQPLAKKDAKTKNVTSKDELPKKPKPVTISNRFGCLQTIEEQEDIKPTRTSKMVARLVFMSWNLHNIYTYLHTYTHTYIPRG